MEINRDYPCHSGNYRRGRATPVSFLVVHYVGATGGARANAAYYSRADIDSSAHFFVGHASEGCPVYASVPEGDTAWHCGAKRYVHPTCRNDNSIGIELCCHHDAKRGWYIDPETAERAAQLTFELMEKYDIDLGHVVRHYDITGKRCPEPWVRDAGAWVRFKERINEMQYEQFKAHMARYEQERAAQTVSSWAAESFQKAKQRGVFDGTAPHNPLTREQAAAVLDRLGLV